MKIYRLKACGKCGGDLARDCGDWICLQCGSYAYVGLYSGTEPRMDSLADLSVELSRLECNPQPRLRGEGAEKFYAGADPEAPPGLSSYPAKGSTISLSAWRACRVTP